MIIQRVDAQDAAANKVYLVCKNQEASAAWVQGAPVTLNASGTDDGFGAIKLATAAKASLLLGVADRATVADAVGWVQCFGLRTDAVVNQAGTASNANGEIGDVLIPWTASGAFSGVAAGAATGYSPWAALMQTVASSTAVATTTASVWLRCM